MPFIVIVCIFIIIPYNAKQSSFKVCYINPKHNLIIISSEIFWLEPRSNGRFFVFISGVKRNKSFSGVDSQGNLLNQFQNTAKELTLDFGPSLWRRRNTSFAVDTQNTSGLIPKSEIKTTAVQGNFRFDRIFVIFKN